MSTSSATTGKKELTLKDRLSRLTYLDACRVLGDEGPQLIRLGGGREIQIDEQVHVGDDLFRLSLPDAVVTITTMAEVKQRLRWNCTQCDSACEHVGAAFSLILEEKMALGLAGHRVPGIPIGNALPSSSGRA